MVAAKRVKTRFVNSIDKSALKCPGGVCEPGIVEFRFTFDLLVSTNTIAASLNLLPKTLTDLFRTMLSHFMGNTTVLISRVVTASAAVNEPVQLWVNSPWFARAGKNSSGRRVGRSEL